MSLLSTRRRERATLSHPVYRAPAVLRTILPAAHTGLQHRGGRSLLPGRLSRFCRLSSLRPDRSRLDTGSWQALQVRIRYRQV